MGAADYDTLVGLARLELDVRKSRFLAIATAVASAEDAMAFFERHRVADATHNCWAYKIGQAYRFNDDGEPGGTAGKPILQAIEGQGLDGVAVLVIRWFGGIKLGAGGLVRAYGGCAAQCLRQAERHRVIATTGVSFVCGFGDLGAVRQRLQQAGALAIQTDFGSTQVAVSAQVPLPELGQLESALADITRGKAGWIIHRSPAADEPDQA